MNMSLQAVAEGCEFNVALKLQYRKWEISTHPEVQGRMDRCRPVAQD